MALYIVFTARLMAGSIQRRLLYPVTRFSCLTVDEKIRLYSAVTAPECALQLSLAAAETENALYSDIGG